VVLAADARLFVAAESRMRRIGVVAVHPDAPRLNGAAEAIAAVGLAAPHAGAKAIERIVGDGQGLVVVLEGRHRYDRTEDLLLEHAHAIMAFEHGRLHIEAAGEVACERVAFAAGEHLRALLLADVDIAQDLFELLGGGLRADHGFGVERIALLDLADAF